MSEIIKTEAIIIYSARWQESSKIVHLFSGEHGYLKVIAKGAFRAKSDFRGILETVNHAEVIISQKSTRSLQILTSASLLNSFLNIREDLQKTSIAFSILEIIKKLLSAHEPVGSFFNYTVDLLQALNSTGTRYTKAYLWHFLLMLSQTLGFGWEFENCLNCKKTLSEYPVVLDYQNGGILCRNCHPHRSAKAASLDQDQLALFRTFAVSTAANLENLNFALLPDFTNVLLQHLAYHTEIPLELKSLKWYV